MGHEERFPPRRLRVCCGAGRAIPGAKAEVAEKGRLRRFGGGLVNVSPWHLRENRIIWEDISWSMPSGP
jgi:hypothetical protein